MVDAARRRWLCRCGRRRPRRRRRAARIHDGRAHAGRRRRLAGSPAAVAAALSRGGAARRARRGAGRRRRRERRLGLRHRRRRRRAPVRRQRLDRAAIPASNQKLFTTAAFLAELGAEGAARDPRLRRRQARRPRRLGARRRPGDRRRRRPGLRHGALRPRQRPAGDPGRRRSRRNVARAGVKRITGRILADDTIFDRERRAGPDLSPLSGLSFNNGYDDGDYASDPELVAAKGLKQALRKRGVAGRAARSATRTCPTPTLRRRAARRGRLADRSRTLIEETNVPSNNFFAEMLLKRLGADERQARAPATAAQRGRGASPSRVGTDVQAVDGSGLSRKQRGLARRRSASCWSAMADDRRRTPPPFATRCRSPAARARSPTAWRAPPPRATARPRPAPSTASRRSRATARPADHTIAFSILINGVNVDAARSAQDRIAAAIARYEP